MKRFVKKWYQGQEAFLKKTGARFWFPWMSEEWYFVIRCLSALLCGVCGLAICGTLDTKLPWFFLGGGTGLVVGYLLPRLVFQISDRRDNELMTADIRKLYEYVKIQIKAGMYLTNTLSACYLSISNPRLKRALLELNSRLIATNSVVLSMDEFSQKFTSEYIAYFCLIVNQSEQSGRMTQMLEDMTLQMKDMERYLMARKKGRMERKVLFLTIFVFIGIILIATYQLAYSLLSSVMGMMS